MGGAPDGGEDLLVRHHHGLGQGAEIAIKRGPVQGDAQHPDATMGQPQGKDPRPVRR